MAFQTRNSFARLANSPPLSLSLSLSLTHKHTGYAADYPNLRTCMYIHIGTCGIFDNIMYATAASHHGICGVSHTPGGRPRSVLVFDQHIVALHDVALLAAPLTVHGTMRRAERLTTPAAHRGDLF